LIDLVIYRSICRSPVAGVRMPVAASSSSGEAAEIGATTRLLHKRRHLT
jgi:hypothetical protein